MAFVHVLNSLTPGVVPTSSLWLVMYVPSSHIGYVPHAVQGEWQIHIESFVWFTHAFLNSPNYHYHQCATGSYYVITDFNHIWDISQLYPVYLDDIIVITLDLGSASVS